MITLTEKLTAPITYDLSSYGKPEDILFFDIETTGFSPDTCSVYLIGCIFYSEGSWLLKQFFADSTIAEGEILLHFFTMLTKYPVLIHFNGDTFDIPFIKKRANKLSVPHITNNFNSVDIYKLVKPYKNLLELSNCKQKTIELLLGISREDKYSGAQLIEIYRNYLITGNEEAKRLLLLHNADDLKGMSALLPVLNYTRLFSGEGHIESIYTTDCCSTERLTITVSYSDICVPVPITIKKNQYDIFIADNTVTVKLTIFTGELKHYYNDYKNYYYLPKEDIAIHKSVADFVDKGYKQKATAKTCYTKNYGRFICGFSKINQPLFFNEFPLKHPYIMISETIMHDKDFWSQYYSLLISNTI